MARKPKKTLQNNALKIDENLNHENIENFNEESYNKQAEVSEKDYKDSKDTVEILSKIDENFSSDYNHNNIENSGEGPNRKQAEVSKEGDEESKDRQYLKGQFKAGAQPTDIDFANVFDSFLNYKDDNIVPAVKDEKGKIVSLGLKSVITEREIECKEIPVPSDELIVEPKIKVRELINFTRNDLVNKINLAKWNLNIDKDDNLYICYNDKAISKISSLQEYVNEDLEKLKNDIKNINEKITPIFNSLPAFYDHSSFSLNNKIYIVGGILNYIKDNCLLLDKKSNAILSYENGIYNYNSSTIELPRSKHIAALIKFSSKNENSVLYVLGGNNIIEKYSVDDAGIFNKEPVIHHNYAKIVYSSYVVAGEKIYVMGGINYNESGSVEYSNIIFTINASGRVEFYGNLKNKRACHSSVIDNDTIYIIGGITINKDGVITFIGDIANRKIGDHNENQTYSSCWAIKNHASVIMDKKIYVIGGIDVSSEYTDRINIFNIATKLIVSHLKLSEPRAYHTAEIIEGKIYVIGGKIGKSDEYSTAAKSVEIIDPKNPAPENIQS